MCTFSLKRAYYGRFFIYFDFFPYSDNRVGVKQNTFHKD